MRVAIFLLAAAFIAGCQGMDDGPEGQKSSQATDADEGADEQASPFFVGHWAAEQALCGRAAWEFSPTRIVTPGHVVCTFDQVEQSAGIYNIDATCTAEGPPEQHRLKISHAQSAKALLVEGGPFAPVGLVACDKPRDP